MLAAGGMTALYLTIDTEYSAGHAVRGMGQADNFALSIAGATPAGAGGIAYQMDVFDACGLKAVFFVDPLPALVWGVEAVAEVVGPIIARGHDVQLHLHTEWLAVPGIANPLGTRTATNLHELDLAEQTALIGCARDLLVAAGAAPPVAFRAGNYGANNDTLRALAHLGIGYDTSHCPGIARSECRISLGPQHRDPLEHCGVIEVPVGCIAARGGGLRHFQLTALSVGEMLAALRHAVARGQDAITLVSHSFELLSRDRQRINPLLRRRFERLCTGIAALPGLTTATYADRPPAVGSISTPLPHRWPRTAARLAEQALANTLYGGR